MNTCACFTPNIVRLNRIVQFAQDFKIDGVIYHVLQACHIYGMEQLRIEKALDKIGIPSLNIETDYSQEDVEQIRTRLEAFLEMVTVRKISKVAPPTQELTTPAPVSATPSSVVGPQQIPGPSPISATASSSTGPSGQPQPSTAPAAVFDPTAAMTPQPTSATTPTALPPSATDPTPISAPSAEPTAVTANDPTPSSKPGAVPPKSAIETEPLPEKIQHPPLPPATKPKEAKQESKEPKAEAK